MSLQKSELVDKNQYELTFTIDHDSFEDAVQRVYKKQAAKITIPGFRRGKAPAGMLKAGSPCIDAGTPANAPATDLFGNARPAGNGVFLKGSTFR